LNFRLSAAQASPHTLLPLFLSKEGRGT